MNQTIKIINDFSEIDTSSTEKVIHQISNQLNLSGSITIKFGSMEESCELNMQFLNKNYDTDVLSFPIKEEFPDGYYLRDLFICLPLAQQQALDNKISVNKPSLGFRALRDQKEAAERRMTVYVDLQLKAADGRVVWSGNRIAANETYPVDPLKQQTEKNKSEAFEALSKRLAEVINNRLTSDF